LPDVIGIFDKQKIKLCGKFPTAGEANSLQRRQNIWNLIKFCLKDFSPLFFTPYEFS